MLSRKSARVWHAWGLVVAAVFLCGVASTAWGAEADYHGTYAGTFEGDDNGVWVAVIGSSPSDGVYLSYSTDYGQGDGGYVHWDGEIGTIGNYYSTSLINGSYSEASVDSTDGTVSGNWKNLPEVGKLSGNRITSCDYEGNYTGTFRGDASGTWTMAIAANGYVTGVMVNDGSSYGFEGGCHPDGRVIVIGEDGYGDYFSVFGQISGSSISGSWTTESGDEGTFKTGSSSSGGGGGGGGGCFILSLIGR